VLIPNSVKRLSWLVTLRMLLKNSHFMFVMFGSTLITFGAGGMADWFPTYLERVHHQDLKTATLVLGGVTVVAGIGGTVFGSLMAEVAKKKTKNPFLAVAGLGMAASTLFAIIVLCIPHIFPLVCVLFFLCEFFLWMYIGPTSAMIANSVPGNIRTRAFSLNLLVTHALGDAISPPIIGAISDGTGSLSTAIIVLPVAFAFSAIVFLTGWLWLPPMVNDFSNSKEDREESTFQALHNEVEEPSDATNYRLMTKNDPPNN